MIAMTPTHRPRWFRRWWARVRRVSDDRNTTGQRLTSGSAHRYPEAPAGVVTLTRPSLDLIALAVDLMEMTARCNVSVQDVEARLRGLNAADLVTLLVGMVQLTPPPAGDFRWSIEHLRFLLAWKEKQHGI